MSLGTLYWDALHVALGDGQNCVCYDYASDFAKLWRRCDGSDEPALLSQCLVPQPSDECQADIGADEHSRHKRIIIVWDGQPPAPAGSVASDDPVHKQLEHHLTPLDWALALSIRVLKDSEICRQACFCINIIDLTAKQYEHAWAMRMRYQLLADMPWVRMFAPQVSGRTAPFQTHGPVLVPDSTSALLVHDSEWMVNVNECAKPIAGSVTSGHRERLMDMARQWSASLTQSNDHHDVNNLVGPIVLDEMLSSGSPSCSSVFVSAFLGKLKWMCLLDFSFQGRLEISESGLRLDKIGIDRLRVLVVDDELSRGWDSIVCRFFSANRGSESLSQDNFVRLDSNTDRQDAHSPVEIYGCTSSLPLTRHLSKKQFVERNFSYSFFSGNNDEIVPEILIVDLRLFGTVNSLKFRDHIEFLVSIIEEYGLTAPENLAWQPIAVSEVEQIKAWLNPKPPQEPVSEAEQIKAKLNRTGNLQGSKIESSLITLLPRILALASPLTPIMLFSATGRADIKEKLRPYRNILTGFSKPQVLQDFASVEDAVIQFLAGRHRALQMLAFRQRLKRCMDSAAKIDLYRNTLQIKPISSAHIDFFFDESAHKFAFDKSVSTKEFQDIFALGSAATVFMDTSDADVLQSYLQAAARTSPTPPAATIPVWAKAKANNGVPLPKFSNIIGDVKVKEAQLNTHLGVIKDAIKKSQTGIISEKWASLGVFRYVGTDLPEQLAQQKHGWADQQLDLMLRFSVQFNVFVLPRLLNIGKLHCSLYFDRRSIPPTYGIDYADATKWNTKAAQAEKKKASELAGRFGVEQSPNGAPLNAAARAANPTGPNQVLVVTYPISSYYPLVREALMGWSPTWAGEVTLENIRGQQLSECWNGYDLNNSDQSRLFEIRRWLHDVADWVAGAERQYNLGAGTSAGTNWATNCLKSQFPHQLRVRLDSGIEACMRAAQNASWARAEECIRSLLQNSRIYDGAKLGEVENILVWVCRDTIKLASGSSLHAVFEGQCRPYVFTQQSEAVKHIDAIQNQSVEPIASILPPVVAAAEPLSDPWEKTASFVAPHGFDLLCVVGIESIQGTNYWVLSNEGEMEMAVAPVQVDSQDPQGQTKIGQVGLWDTGTFRGFIERPNRGGYAVFTLERWFDGQPNFCGSIPSSSIETLPESDAPSAGIADLGQTYNVESPVVLEVTENHAPLGNDSLSTSKGFQTWEELIGDRVDVIEAKVFSIDTKIVKFKSANQNDRQVYLSDCFLTLALLTRGDKVIIRPKQVEGQYMKVAGYVEIDVIAYYSESAGSWYILTLIE